jgi:hypothetical protein
MTSGMTKGAVTIPDSKVRDRKRPKRANTKAAIVPIVVATQAVTAAIRKLSSAASSIGPLSANFPYHFSEKPPHTVTNFDSLKEKTIMDRIGTYKNAKPNTSDESENVERLPFMVVNALRRLRVSDSAEK